MLVQINVCWGVKKQALLRLFFDYGFNKKTKKWEGDLSIEVRIMQPHRKFEKNFFFPKLEKK